MTETNENPVPAADPRAVRLAEVEREIADLTSPEKVSWAGNSEALRRYRAERGELTAAIAAQPAA